MTAVTYIREFNEAIKFSTEMKLEIPQNIEFDSNHRYFTEEGNLKLLKLYDNIFQSKLKSRLDMKIFASGMIANCSPFHYFLKNHIEQELGCKAYFTIGYVLFDNDSQKTYHKITQDDIEYSLINGDFPKDHHAWLTLDSGEILDMTFMTTFLSVTDDDFNTKLEQGEIEINFINRHTDEFQHGMTYKPVVVGDDFFRKIGFDLEDVSYMLYNKYSNK